MVEVKRCKQLDPKWGKGKGFGKRQPQKLTVKKMTKIYLEARAETSRRLEALAKERPDLQIKWAFDGGKRIVSAAPGKQQEVTSLYVEIFNSVMAEIKAEHGISNKYRTPASDIKTWQA